MGSANAEHKNDKLSTNDTENPQKPSLNGKDFEGFTVNKYFLLLKAKG